MTRDIHASDDTPWRVREARRLAVFGVFVLALGAAGLGDAMHMVGGAAGGLAGYAVATGLHALWGERTRPKPNGPWALLAIIWVILLVFSLDASWAEGQGLFIGAAVAIGLALSFRHDLGNTPTLFLAGTLWAILMPEGRLDTLGDPDATWVGIATVLGITAATLEHERLQVRSGHATNAPWTVIRLAFVSLWTLIILSVREDVAWGKMFAVLGADLRGASGQMLLVGILLAAVAVAAFALRPAAPKAPRQGPERPPGLRPR